MCQREQCIYVCEWVETQTEELRLTFALESLHCDQAIAVSFISVVYSIVNLQLCAYLDLLCIYAYMYATLCLL